MRVAFAADHAGAALKDELLERLGGAPGRPRAHRPRRRRLATPHDDYPDFAARLGRAIRDGEADRGILICGSGVGASVAANKIRGIRAAVCHDTYSAHQGVEHDDMNVLTLGARVIGIELAVECSRAFLGATFSGEPRHRRRLAKVLAIEAGRLGPPIVAGAWPTTERRRGTRRASSLTPRSSGGYHRRDGAKGPVTETPDRPARHRRRSPRRSSPGPGTSAGPSGSSSATRASGRPTRTSRRRSPSGSGWLDAPGPLRRARSAPLEAFGEAIRDAGFTTAIVGRDGRQQPRPGGPPRTFGDGGDWLDAPRSSTRPTRRPSRRPSTTSTRSRRCSSSRRSRARPPSRSPSWPTPGSAIERALAGAAISTSDAGRLHGR